MRITGIPPMIKYLLALLLLVLLALGLWLHRGADRPVDNTPVTGLPWQIDRLPDGATRVFGIVPGRTTLDEATQRLGLDREIALIAAPDEAGTLEAYYSHYSAGPITGILILVLDVPDQDLVAWRARAYHETGTRRYRLDPDDLARAGQAPIRVITFAPSISLDEAVVRSRFGTPQAVVETGMQERHLLFPEQGLDAVLNSSGKDLLQYLSPRAFAAWREHLYRSAARQTP
jgi:hypothetical protein